MSYKFVIPLILSMLVTPAFAQQSSFRKQRPEETAFLNKLHQALYSALPHTYKDWTTAPESDFDAVKYWCAVSPDWHDCTGEIPVTIGKSDPYSLNWQMDFNMPDNESISLKMAVMHQITDYHNGAQIAKAIKSGNKTKLRIFLVANVPGGDFALTYCAKTLPVAIALPVSSTLAVLGIKSAECPILSGGSPDLSANYYDNAIIFLGKPASSKTSEHDSDGFTTTRYNIGYNNALNNKLIVQNIALKLSGDAADIAEAIKLIDWQKLSDLIEK